MFMRIEVGPNVSGLASQPAVGSWSWGDRDQTWVHDSAGGRPAEVRGRVRRPRPPGLRRAPRLRRAAAAPDARSSGFDLTPLSRRTSLPQARQTTRRGAPSAASAGRGSPAASSPWTARAGRRNRPTWCATLSPRSSGSSSPWRSRSTGAAPASGSGGSAPGPSAWGRAWACRRRAARSCRRRHSNG